MADPKGFLKYTERILPARRPVTERTHDWHEIYEQFNDDTLRQQAARCMDCGIPFCHTGCPLGNLIPEWNDLVRTGRWREAIDRLHATNNFPDFTGRLCPAPCEPACVLGINQPPVTIKQIEYEIIEHAFKKGWIHPIPPQTHTGKTIAIVGSGPAGLAAAQQLTRAGHTVTVFERHDRIGGLLRYGIPEFKMEKRILDRRLDQMTAEGTLFHTNTNVGIDITAHQLRTDFDATILAGGATNPRDLPAPGRDLAGIHQAMEYLPWANRVQAGDLTQPPITATGKKVIIIGGGDTGADCLGTVHRQGGTIVHQFEIMPRPPDTRDPSTPWPTYPLIMRTSAAHEEGGKRIFAVNTEKFTGHNGHVTGLRAHHVQRRHGTYEKINGTDFELHADLILLAMGFTGPEHTTLLTDLQINLTPHGNIARNTDYTTNIPNIYAAGDMGRGQSLIVWAIAEGRATAANVDHHLMGQTTLPTPIKPTTTPIH